MLTLHLIRGPLEEERSKRILSEYNRLTSAGVTQKQFHHWLEESYAGPALHALLSDENGIVVGHCCLFPFTMRYESKTVLAAKAEYLFLAEKSRSERIAGYEDKPIPAALILLRALYKAGLDCGWDPIVGSAPEQVAALHRLAGCKTLSFPLHECLLIRRPFLAASRTPNLTRKQKAAVFGIGVAQRIARPVWLQLANLIGYGASIKGRHGATGLHHEQVSLDCSTAFRGWRYPNGEYSFQQSVSASDCNLILKRGDSSNYLRVCEERIEKPLEVDELVRQLLFQAEAESAIGIRWAVYEGQWSDSIRKGLLRNGFVCIQRTRTIQIATRNREFLNPEKWIMNDSFVAFDH